MNTSRLRPTPVTFENAICCPSAERMALLGRYPLWRAPSSRFTGWVCPCAKRATHLRRWSLARPGLSRPLPVGDQARGAMCNERRAATIRDGLLSILAMRNSNWSADLFRLVRQSRAVGRPNDLSSILIDREICLRAAASGLFRTRRQRRHRSSRNASISPSSEMAQVSSRSAGGALVHT